MGVRLGWFSTGRDRAAIDLFEIINKAITDGTIDAEMAFCFVNRDNGEAPGSDEFIATALGHGVPVVTLSSDAFEPARRMEGRTDLPTRESWRLDYDRAVIHALDGREADIVFLAGYMLIVGPEMCERYTMINLHPALPDGPTGTWQQVINKLLETGARDTGAMMHLVTPELDRGPVIAYFKIPVRGGFDQIRHDGVVRELPLILLTVKEFADGNLAVRDRKVFAGGVEITAGYDLTDEIEEWLKKDGGSN
jgi:phosphoribosylglycinamide formyltransferase-1